MRHKRVLEPLPRVLVVIPTYNNPETLPQIVAEVAHFHHQVVVVDDGSLPAVVLNTSPDRAEAKLLRHPVNAGKGQAILTAVSYAREQGFSHVITIDADGQHLAADLPRLLSAVVQHPGALVLGDRGFGQRATAAMVPRSSRWGNWFSNFWVFCETGRWLADTQTGYRCYPLALPFDQCQCRAYDFEIEIIVRSLWAHHELVSVPIAVRYPKDRLSHFDALRDNFKLSVLHTKLVTQRIFSRLYRQLRPEGRSRSKASLREVQGAGFLQAVTYFLPRWLCYLLAVVPVSFVYFGHSKRRQGITTFYRQLGLSPWRGIRNFWYFAVSLIDRSYFARGRLGSAMVFRQGPLWPPQPGPGIMVGCHYGDWLLCGVTMAKKADRGFGLVLRSDQTPGFHQRMQEFLPSSLTIIDAAGEPSQVILQIKNLLDQGALICFMVDRLPPLESIDPAKQRSVMRQPFLGREALWLKTPFRLAERYQVPLSFFFCRKWGPWPWSPYRFEWRDLSQLSQSPGDLGPLFVEQISDLVRQHPEHWFNFIDFWHQAIEVKL